MEQTIIGRKDVLDDLIAKFVRETGKVPSEIALLEFIVWVGSQE